MVFGARGRRPLRFGRPVARQVDLDLDGDGRSLDRRRGPTVPTGYGLPLALFILGVVLQGIEATQPAVPKDVSFWLFVLGGASSVMGSVGIGQRYGREQTNEALRVKLATAFRRTARLYERLRIVQANVTEARAYILAAGGESKETLGAIVTGALGLVAVRLDEQITTYDNALDEWNELVPTEVERERRRLAGKVISRA
jgi:hypothetical protein